MMYVTNTNFFLGMFCLLAVLIVHHHGKPLCQYGGKFNSKGECICPNFDNCTEMEGACGSNGVEYMNECELKKDACGQQKNFFLFKKGMCGRSFGIPCGLFDCPLAGSCKHGLIQDGFGCFHKCQCRASPCPSMSSCNLSCDGKGGVVLDEQYCPTCKCSG
ncbi:agrin-like [Dendronephthya gigantea]|uniref:agrin-like n=1 Tax=Dendronephthya gigantea TaxID=151771 RepID=UPI00106B888E|nr:agrin-like [Dendronephthya gigantea]